MNIHPLLELRPMVDKLRYTLGGEPSSNPRPSPARIEQALAQLPAIRAKVDEVEALLLRQQGRNVQAARAKDLSLRQRVAEWLRGRP